MIIQKQNLKKCNLTLVMLLLCLIILQQQVISNFRSKSYRRPLMDAIRNLLTICNI